MALERYSVGAVVLSAEADTVIGGITQMAVNMGAEVRAEVTSGKPTPTFNSITGIKPAASFTSRAIDEILDNFPTTGLDISSLNNGLDLYLHRHKAGGTRDPAASVRYRIAEGIVGLTTLSVDHQGDASIGGSILPTWDGTNDPVVKAEGIAFPTVAGENRYTLGPVKIGGITFNNVQSMEIDFGQNAQSVGSDSDIYDRRASIRDYAPVITLRGEDPDWWLAGAVPTTGLAATHANSVIYLRKRLQGGTYVAVGTEVHISITFDGTAVIDTPAEGSGNDPSETSLRIVLREAAGAAPMVIDTTAAVV